MNGTSFHSPEKPALLNAYHSRYGASAMETEGEMHSLVIQGIHML